MGIITPATGGADSNHSSTHEKEGGGCGQGLQWASAHPVVCSLNPYSRNVESTLCLHPAAECEVLLCIVLRTFLERLS